MVDPISCEVIDNNTELGPNQTDHSGPHGGNKRSCNRLTHFGSQARVRMESRDTQQTEMDRSTVVESNQDGDECEVSEGRSGSNRVQSACPASLLSSE
jgi:hypothetical protein